MRVGGGRVLLEQSCDGRVATLTLSYPGKLNVVTMEMRRQIGEHFSRLAVDSQVRVVIVRGEGEHFSAGGDIAEFMESQAADLTNLGHDIGAPARSPKPVIAVVNGYCLGVGFELALCCDLRFATASSQFGLPEIRLGMIPGSGGTQRLARYVGMSRAKFHVMTAGRIDGLQAERWGLVVKTAEDMAGLESEVGRTVDLLLSYSPLALRTAKEVLDQGCQGPLATGIELEGKAYAMLRSTEDFAEGVSAYLGKRSPAFKGR